MAAKKDGAKVAKKSAAKVAKKGAGKARKQTAPVPCPDSPKPFFRKVAEFADGMKKWASQNNEIENCFLNHCGTDPRVVQLHRLCDEFKAWAIHAKYWADDVEQCWEDECESKGDRGHTRPPDPPF